MGLNIISKSYNEPVMQSEYSILSEGFKITIQGLTLAAGNQFHICNGSSDYGLYTGDTYTTSTKLCYNINSILFKKSEKLVC